MQAFVDGFAVRQLLVVAVDGSSLVKTSGFAPRHSMTFPPDSGSGHIDQVNALTSLVTSGSVQWFA